VLLLLLPISVFVFLLLQRVFILLWWKGSTIGRSIVKPHIVRRVILLRLCGSWSCPPVLKVGLIAGLSKELSRKTSLVVGSQRLSWFYRVGSKVLHVHRDMVSFNVLWHFHFLFLFVVVELLASAMWVFLVVILAVKRLSILWVLVLEQFISILYALWAHAAPCDVMGKVAKVIFHICFQELSCVKLFKWTLLESSWLVNRVVNFGRGFEGLSRRLTKLVPIKSISSVCSRAIERVVSLNLSFLIWSLIVLESASHVMRLSHLIISFVSIVPVLVVIVASCRQDPLIFLSILSIRVFFCLIFLLNCSVNWFMGALIVSSRCDFVSWCLIGWYWSVFSLIFLIPYLGLVFLLK